MSGASEGKGESVCQENSAKRPYAPFRVIGLEPKRRLQKDAQALCVVLNGEALMVQSAKPKGCRMIGENRNKKTAPLTAKLVKKPCGGPERGRERGRSA